mgnify:CR=1 FL=1
MIERIGFSRAKRMIMIDIIVDLVFGDSCKHKIACAILENKKFDYVFKYNGSSNSGNSSVHNGKKIVTHQIPPGVFYDVKSIIGPQCFLNPYDFFRDISNLERNGIVNAAKNIFVDKRTHVVQYEHIKAEENEQRIGTTRKGVGFCASDKVLRVGKRVEDYPELEDYMIDVHDIFSNLDKEDAEILFVGSQGTFLDIDHGTFPYCTSTNTIQQAAFLTGANPKKLRIVWGVCKSYDTYVGNQDWGLSIGSNDEKMLVEYGKEFGETTGRRRKVDWLNLDNLIIAANLNHVDCIVMSKIDVVERINKFCFYYQKELRNFNTFSDMQFFIESILFTKTRVKNIFYSGTPNHLELAKVLKDYL